MPAFLRQNSPVLSLESEESMKGGVYAQLSQTDSEISQSNSLKNRSDFSLGSVGLNHNFNSNSNNNNGSGDGTNLPPTRRRTTSPGYLTRPSHNKAATQKSASLPKSYSSDELAADAATVGGKLQRKKSSSMELLDTESFNNVMLRNNKSQTTSKPPLPSKRRPPLHHRYSSPILDTSNTSQKSDDSFWFEYGCV